MKIKAIFSTLVLSSLIPPLVTACDGISLETTDQNETTYKPTLVLLSDAFEVSNKRITALQILEFSNPDNLLLIAPNAGLNSYAITNIQHSAVDPLGGFNNQDRSGKKGEVILFFSQDKVK